VSRRPRVPGAVRLVAVALLAAAALLPAWAGPARAADIVFGSPDATSTYTEGIEFTVPITTSERPERIEIRLRYPGGLGPFIEEIPVPAPGSQTLTYRLDTSGGGHIVPNTVIEATWAAVPQGGGEPVLSATKTIRYEDTTKDWRTLKGDIVVVHWYDGSEAFARRALEIGDKAVKQTADLLGVTETEPIDFFIYGDDASFRTALGPGTRENVGGQAHANIRTLFAMITPGAIDDTWVGVVVPHELVHLVFDTAVDNPFRFPPRWMNEGLAVYLSEGYTPTDRNTVADAVDSRELLPLTALTGQFPTDSAKTYLAYAESVSAIDHLVRTYGEDALWTLVDAYAEGLTDDEALTRATGRDMASFQAGWLAELGAETPQQYGPAPQAPGPLPPGWDAPAGGGAPAATPPLGAPAPSRTAQPGNAPEPASGGSAVPLLLAAIAGVALVVLVALVLARRRAPAP
jgi:Peptidase MA superfamily